MMSLQSSGATDVGLQRSNNEDALASDPKHGIWVVADGMGGHAAGEVASQITVQTIIHETSQGVSLGNAIQHSHRNILRAGQDGQGEEGMGSTVVALQSRQNKYEVCWVGDSRAYMWLADENRLEQLSTDHSYVQMLYQSGAISESELDTHPEKNIITQCLGSLELEEIRVDSVRGEWHKGNTMLLCSDGLTDIVSDTKIIHILSTAKTLDHATQALITAALEAGGKDNITVQLISNQKERQSIRERIKGFFS